MLWLFCIFCQFPFGRAFFFFFSTIATGYSYWDNRGIEFRMLAVIVEFGSSLIAFQTKAFVYSAFMIINHLFFAASSISWEIETLQLFQFLAFCCCCSLFRLKTATCCARCLVWLFTFHHLPMNQVAFVGKTIEKRFALHC